MKSAKDRNDLQTARTAACSRPRSHHCEPGSSKAGKTGKLAYCSLSLTLFLKHFSIIVEILV